MKWMLSRFLGALGVAMLMVAGGTTLTVWSPNASAQQVYCSGTTCYYGPICPDAWGGCYWYSWKIGSAVNAWEEKSGIANVVKLCDPSKLETCVYVTSKVTLTASDYPNALITCRVPGADTCTDFLCGGSPNSSSWIFASQTYVQSTSSTLDSSECTKDDKSKGGIKCSKTNTLNGPDNLSGQFCPNQNWIAHWTPINFIGEMEVKGPQSKRELSTIVTTYAKTHCWLLDSNGLKPDDPSGLYDLSINPSANTLFCENLENTNN